jgi:hypothetical protein
MQPIGLARRARPHQQVERVELAMKERFQATGETQREIGEFVYPMFNNPQKNLN